MGLTLSERGNLYSTTHPSKTYLTDTFTGQAILRILIYNSPTNHPTFWIFLPESLSGVNPCHSVWSVLF